LEQPGLYASQNIIGVIKSRRMRWMGHVTQMREMRNACIILVGKHEGNRPLERYRCKWEDVIRMDLGENRVGRCGFSRRTLLHGVSLA
jgi:hypothetical protein